MFALLPVEKSSTMTIRPRPRHGGGEVGADEARPASDEHSHCCGRPRRTVGVIESRRSRPAAALVRRAVIRPWPTREGHDSLEGQTARPKATISPPRSGACERAAASAPTAPLTAGAPGQDGQRRRQARPRRISRWDVWATPPRNGRRCGGASSRRPCHIAKLHSPGGRVGQRSRGPLRRSCRDVLASTSHTAARESRATGCDITHETRAGGS